MAIDLYKKMLSDKGSTKQGTVNLPLSDYLVDSDETIEFLNTQVITMNLLLSGRYNGGIPLGRITMMSSPSKYGKTFVSLSIIKSAQKKGKTVVVIDTEHRFPFVGAKSFGIDVSPEKLLVFRENSIEQVQTIITKLISDIPRQERKDILFVIDSFGTLVSSKTLEDAELGKDVKDMTLTQKKNALANIMLNTKCTYFVINHCYDNTGGFGDPLAIPGGRRIYFNSSSVILCTSRAKDKDKEKNILGYIISAKAHKGDFCKEDTNLQFRIKLKGGLDTFYGLLDDAVAGGYLDSPKPGSFVRHHITDDVAVKEPDIYTADFWLPIFKQTDFGAYLEKIYKYENEFDIVTNEDRLDKIDEVENIIEGETEISTKKVKK